MLSWGVMEIAERYLFIIPDAGVDDVRIFDHTFIFIADTVNHIRLTVKGCFRMNIRKCRDFLAYLSGLRLCDKFGGLYAVHHKPQFVRLKGWI